MNIEGFIGSIKNPELVTTIEKIQVLEGGNGKFPKTRKALKDHLPASAQEFLEISKDGKITATGREPNV
ncbi:MAG: hypothetical protein KC582_03605 [Candidatus Magasanikbacteria bacterium]|nr:hypothetical protein [Candidatus Magasanikbacteria bacterium]